MIIKKKVELLNVARYDNEEIATIVYQVLQDAKANEEYIQYIKVDAVTGNLEYEVIKIKDYWLDLGCKEDIPKIEKVLNNLPDED